MRAAWERDWWAFWPLNREDRAGDGSADIREDKVWFFSRFLERLVPVRKAEGGFRVCVEAALTSPPFPCLRFSPPPTWPWL